jgi:hypothetical protein
METASRTTQRPTCRIDSTDQSSIWHHLAQCWWRMSWSPTSPISIFKSPPRYSLFVLGHGGQLVAGWVVNQPAISSDSGLAMHCPTAAHTPSCQDCWRAGTGWQAGRRGAPALACCLQAGSL